MKKANKTILVTGSGTGIGQAIARKFAKFGYNIIILGRRKEPLIEASNILSEIMKNEGHESSVIYYAGVDVAEENALDKMFQDIKDKFGNIDIIVNNAGVSGPVKIFTNSLFSDFKECVSIHLSGTFWTTTKGLSLLNNDGKIVTISTFFTEENKFEQRPYRFRTPYTAAQGAKNRLSEALGWELAEKGIKSVATNPGPVHSDRIYKTVYPKAAAEFLRIGGFEGLTPKQIEKITTSLLPFLGEDPKKMEIESLKISKELLAEEHDEESTKRLQRLCIDLLNKTQEIAEKVQSNTRKMIVDNEFLTQDDVAEMVYNLSSDTMSNLVNGRIIPNDRVFYPVKPIVNRQVVVNTEKSLENKIIVITCTIDNLDHLVKVKEIASKINSFKVKQLIVLTHKNNKSEQINSMFEEFHHHNIDLSDEITIKKIYNTIATHFGKIDSAIHITGNYNYENKMISLTRNDWDSLVDQFINIPHLITRQTVLSMATEEALENPSKFKTAVGNIVIVGPDSPIGKKISGEVRARSEIFRGALRPYITTANQELHDVLNSKINLTLILQGNVNGDQPDYQKLEQSLLWLCSQEELKNNLINYIDE